MTQVSSDFKHVFTPLDLGPARVHNRIYMTPHSLDYSDPVVGEPGHFLPSDMHAFYYAERAKGGVGLIIHEGAMVSPKSDLVPYPTSCVYDPRCVPKLQKIARMVHEYGSQLFIELWHAGHHCTAARRIDHPMDWYVPLSASQVPAVEGFYIPKEMEQSDIDEVVEDFGKAAGYVKSGGYDGIEIHATHSYLIEQFLSPFYNKRTDRYGGSVENRLRFMLEILGRIREEIGSEMALGARMIADELTVGGLSNEDMAEIARLLESSGKMDFLDVDLGTYHTFQVNVAPLYIPRGHQVDYIANVKSKIKMPVLGCAGRLNDLRDAERYLAEGKMDMVGGARGFIAEPELVKKTLEGREDEIIRCTGCNQFCLQRNIAGLTIHCTINPVTGREREWGAGTIKLAPEPKRVLVVGGGPAGMEAARVLAMRGHNVTLCEKSDRLGGQMRLGGMLPGRDAIGSTAAWYERQLAKLGVRLALGKDVNSDYILREKPDAVVVATGSSYVRNGLSGFIPSPIQGWEQGNVVIPEQILKGDVSAGKRVVILDDEGFVTAPGLAEMLAEKGSSVEIVTRWHFVGPSLMSANMFYIIYARLFSKGVKMRPNTYIKEIKESKVTLFNIISNEEEVVDADTVVMVTSKASENRLYRELKEKLPEIYNIGDSLTPRSIGEAIYEGHAVGRSI